jgi:hypothetical protein
MSTSFYYYILLYQQLGKNNMLPNVQRGIQIRIILENLESFMHYH